MSALNVVRAGMLTTVQDLGRWGYQGEGVPVAGPMDAYSHRLANRLVGNPEDCATLEVTLIGPELEAAGEVTCAVTGAEFALGVDGRSMPSNAPFVVPAGGRLKFGARQRGSRAYLAVLGGFDVPRTFGSRSTSLISGIGPFEGRALKGGDQLPIGPQEKVAGTFAEKCQPPFVGRPGVPLPLPEGGARVRVVPGPHDAMFTPAALETLFSERFLISPQSNRMGYRLEGAPLRHTDRADILSDATPMGSLQVPGSGQAILLMADRQTTGGYPKIATVITADLPIVGQLAPGDWISFASCAVAEAITALKLQDAQLSGRA